MHTHRYAGRDQVCRVLVVPAPAGTAHRVILVPREVRLEDALQRELERSVKVGKEGGTT